MTEWVDMDRRRDRFEERKYAPGLVGRVGAFPPYSERFAMLYMDDEVVWSYFPRHGCSQQEVQAEVDKQAAKFIAWAQRCEGHLRLQAAPSNEAGC